MLFHKHVEWVKDKVSVRNGVILSCWILAVVACIAVRYQYSAVSYKQGTTILRSNRFTGRSDLLSEDKWVPVRRQDATKAISSIPSTERELITGNADIDRDGMVFKGTIYNGSSWNVVFMCLNVTVCEKNGKVRWSKVYQTRTSIEPLTAGAISFLVAPCAYDDSVTWGIAQAKGYRYEDNEFLDSSFIHRAALVNRWSELTNNAPMPQIVAYSLKSASQDLQKAFALVESLAQQQNIKKSPSTMSTAQ